MFRLFGYFSFPSFFLFLCFLPGPCFPARITPGQVTVITTDDHNATWHNFTRFQDAERGSHVSGMSELKKYFQRFGYLSIPDSRNDSFTDVFDAQFETAVILYQTKFGLPVSGKLDSETISAIVSPRCGVSDTGPTLHATKHFAYFYGRPRWDGRASPMTLTYAFSPSNMIDYISSPEIRAVFQRSFSRWASVIPVNFTETEDYKSANIKIGFFRGDHGDGEPFDGVLGVLAHAFSPENGRLHLDEAETWAVDFGKVKSKVAVDLESVATHEIGHVLGLAHSSVQEAVMYPSLRPRRKRVDLKLDDVQGVQALYGSNPNFKYSSLLASEHSSNQAIGLHRDSSVDHHPPSNPPSEPTVQIPHSQDLLLLPPPPDHLSPPNPPLLFAASLAPVTVTAAQCGGSGGEDDVMSELNIKELPGTFSGMVSANKSLIRVHSLRAIEFGLAVPSSEAVSDSDPDHTSYEIKKRVWHA
ncbi:hypothetical protein V6N12_038332 [Hibiscus sabdariffa]|uniref:Peptidase metallopeptidase domain-containing protein n=1 Tax=Hibiscus sabdariffa TaxID=183260 RepID=A0ABR2BEM9_9ROSI